MGEVKYLFEYFLDEKVKVVDEDGTITYKNMHPSVIIGFFNYFEQVFCYEEPLIEFLDPDIVEDENPQYIWYLDQELRYESAKEELEAKAESDKLISPLEP